MLSHLTTLAASSGVRTSAWLTYAWLTHTCPTHPQGSSRSGWPSGSRGPRARPHCARPTSRTARGGARCSGMPPSESSRIGSRPAVTTTPSSEMRAVPLPIRPHQRGKRFDSLRWWSGPHAESCRRGAPGCRVVRSSPIVPIGLAARGTGGARNALDCPSTKRRRKKVHTPTSPRCRAPIRPPSCRAGLLCLFLSRASLRSRSCYWYTGIQYPLMRILGLQIRQVKKYEQVLELSFIYFPLR